MIWCRGKHRRCDGDRQRQLRSAKSAVYFLAVLWSALQFGCSGPGQQDQNDSNSPSGPATPSKINAPRPAQARKFFGIESARIAYQYSGIYSGNETFYFTDWGNTVVLVEDMVQVGSRIDRTIIWADQRTRAYDHLTRTVSTNRLRSRRTEPPAAARLSDQQLASVGYKRLPDEDIAGKPCKVFENTTQRVKIWLWRGIEMKLINRLPGLREGYTREALTIEEGITVPEELLARPADYSGGGPAP